MPWLVRDSQVLATVEVATSWRDRSRGLLGRSGIDGAILLTPARSVHSFRMRFPIDVAFCDAELRVLKVCTLEPNRVTRPVLRARSILECEAGMARKWGIAPGTRLEVRGSAEGGDVLDMTTGGRVEALKGAVRRRLARDAPSPSASDGAP